MLLLQVLNEMVTIFECTIKLNWTFNSKETTTINGEKKIRFMFFDGVIWSNVESLKLVKAIEFMCVIVTTVKSWQHKN